MVAHNLIDSGM